MSAYQEFLAFAHELADAAREVTLAYFRQPLTIENKADQSPVTIADKKTEALLREHINRRYPDHGIIGEEQAAQAGAGTYEWILDPIDGTRSFISGYPLYGTMICLLKDGLPIVSVVDIPAQDERFFATADGKTHYRKGDSEPAIHSSPCQHLDQAMLFSTDVAMFNTVEAAQIADLRQTVAMVRYNGDCYLYAMLAAGWIDIVLETDLKVYDFMPLMLIVQQAGGVISDWQGKKLTKNSRGQVLATANPALHQAALSLIKTEAEAT